MSDCSKVCMECSEFIEFKVNEAALHGLCKSHGEAINKVQFQCGHCLTYVGVRFLVKADTIDPCICCYKSSRKKCSSKQHYFCELCQSALKNCPFCYCQFCQRLNHPSFGCELHPCCSDCFKVHQNKCFFCNCQSCGGPHSIYKLEDCSHTLCKNCLNTTLCQICEKKCKYCDSVSNYSKPFCVKHYTCEDCDNNLVRKIGKCLICSGEDIVNRKCFKCNKFKHELSKFCDSESHLLCAECSGLGKCETCQECSFCNKKLECIQIENCQHKLCKWCHAGEVCKKCEYEQNRGLCENCEKETTKDLKFSCGQHLACQMCLENNCKTCFSICSICNIMKETKQGKQKCAHFICGECLEDGKQCLDCKKCSKCKKYSILPEGLCGEKICVKCLTLTDFHFELSKERINLEQLPEVIQEKIKDENTKLIVLTFPKTESCHACSKPCNLCGNSNNFFSLKDYCTKCVRKLKKSVGIFENCRECGELLIYHEIIDQKFRCKESPCEKCEKRLKTNEVVSKCRHKFCGACAELFYCEKCFQQCEVCSEFFEKNIERICKTHSMCQSCINQNRETCERCLICASHCLLCNQIVKASCKSGKYHEICDSCIYVNKVPSDCKVCNQNYQVLECDMCKKINYCRESAEEQKLCDNCIEEVKAQQKEACHFCNSGEKLVKSGLCGKMLCSTGPCMKYQGLESCPVCSNLQKLCNFCGDPDYGILLDCGHHSCVKCNKNHCEICYGICLYCMKFQKIATQCNHKICTNCFVTLRNTCWECKGYTFCTYCQQWIAHVEFRDHQCNKLENNSANTYREFSNDNY